MSGDVITYEQISYMYPVKDIVTNQEFRCLGKVTNPGIINTMAVTDDKGGTWFYCLTHQESYHPAHGFCGGCRMQPRAEAGE